jgi:hypothetical protein
VVFAITFRDDALYMLAHVAHGGCVLLYATALFASATHPCVFPPNLSLFFVSGTAIVTEIPFYSIIFLNFISICALGVFAWQAPAMNQAGCPSTGVHRHPL